MNIKFAVFDRTMPTLMKIVFPAIIFFLLHASPAHTAVNCELNYPASDVARLFPESDNFRKSFFSFALRGGQPLMRKVEARLGGVPGLYAPLNVPYTLYEIYKGEKKIGYIHGVTQKGRFGGINIFLVLDLDERIKTFYIQKMSGEYAGKFRDAEFGKQFVGLTIADFDQYDVITGKGTGKVSGITNPAPEAENDFRYIMRGTKKNLILVNEFIPMSLKLPPKKGVPAK